MTPEQRYFFDAAGYLHLEQVLQGDELGTVQEAVDRYFRTPEAEMPPGFGSTNGSYKHTFAFDKSLEALTRHPATWPIITELTDDRPRLAGGTMRIETRKNGLNAKLHSAREGLGPQTPRYLTAGGRILCDYFVVFFYFTDVYPGDGGLLVVPGSHKANFQRPPGIFYKDGDADNGYDADNLPPGILNPTPKAGDVFIISELLTHGVLPWKPPDRDRRFMMLRYVPQYMGPIDDNLPFPFPEEIQARLSPETLELIEFTGYNRIKSVVEESHELSPAS